MCFFMGSIFSKTNRSSRAFCFLMLLLLSFSLEISQSWNSTQDEPVCVEININGEECESGEDDQNDDEKLLLKAWKIAHFISLQIGAIPIHGSANTNSSADIDVPPPRA